MDLQAVKVGFLVSIPDRDLEEFRGQPSETLIIFSFQGTVART